MLESDCDLVVCLKAHIPAHAAGSMSAKSTLSLSAASSATFNTCLFRTEQAGCLLAVGYEAMRRTEDNGSAAGTHRSLASNNHCGYEVEHLSGGILPAVRLFVL